MQLTTGARLLHYVVKAPLGKGGMGEVYRAEDTKLGREVAIKILPEIFTEDSERLARFDREARLLASLGHPAIASIHGLENAEGTRFLVMELAAGTTLADRLASGPIPLDQALEIARQIAEALEAAHEKGIVHRDLKPANIMVDDEGAVKILDFGLARTMQGDEAEGDLSNSPTMVRAATHAGLILGTAGYMSPEQARGRPVDERADIWSFGVVVWEMLTARRLFDGETISDTLAAVLTAEIDLGALPGETPPHVSWLLARCLERNPRRRLRSAGDLRLLLDAPGFAAAHDLAAIPAPSSHRRERLAHAAVIVLLITLVATLLARRPGATEEQVLQVAIPLPPATRLALTGIQPGPPAVDPQGTRIAFVTEEKGGTRRLQVRELEASRSRALEGTEGASYPFWSADGNDIGFFADGKLKRVPAKGGTVLTITDAPNPKGGSWNRDGVIVFCPKFDAPLFKVGASGGAAEQLTRLDFAAGDSSHRFPQFLADGKRFLYIVRKRSDAGNVTRLGSLDGGDGEIVMKAESHTISAGGHLLFVRNRTLMAQPFDEKKGKLAGTPAPLVENVRLIPGAAYSVISASDDVLVFQTGVGIERQQLLWVDRTGQTIAELGEPAPHRSNNVILSADGSQIASVILDPSRGTRDIWIIDAASGNRERLTFDPGNEQSPVWSPDGAKIAYSSNASGPFVVTVETLEQRGNPQVLIGHDDPNKDMRPSSWSPDGKHLLYDVENLTTNTTSIMLFDFTTGRSTLLSEVSVRYPRARFSTDGRWISFNTLDNDGVPSIFVTSFPGVSRRWQVDAGEDAFWSRDGSEMFFTNQQSQLHAVRLAPRGDVFAWGTVTRLFDIEAIATGSDGKRFLVVRDPDAGSGADPLEVIVNWRRLAAR
ncbi:MAG TPA: protein kinase [Thermoanaerobaculia bacterium]|nr:protein kinase [Thermoanaerobaculia bacterium]